MLMKPKVERMKPIIKPKKVRGSYTNWFTPTLWPPIYKAVKQHRNITEAWSFLRSAYRKPGDLSCVYDNLSKSSMREWFHPNGDLKETYKRCVDFGTYFAKTAQRCPILESNPILKDEICAILRNKRKAGQPLYAVCIQPLIKAIIQEKAPELLASMHKTLFSVSYAWTKNFVKSELNWSYRAATNAARKLPKYYEHQGKAMAKKYAYLVSVHNIPSELVINIDQTGIHLVLIGGSRTWKTKNAKHIRIHR